MSSKPKFPGNVSHCFLYASANRQVVRDSSAPASHPRSDDPHSGAHSTKVDNAAPRGIFFFFGHNFSQQLLRGQSTIHLHSGISSGDENVPVAIDEDEPVGPEIGTVREQHDVALAQFFDDDRSDVEQIAISNCRYHACPARSESKPKSARQQCLTQNTKELRMRFVFSGRSQGSSPLRWGWGGNDRDSREQSLLCGAGRKV
jgi:hypothetical protein